MSVSADISAWLTAAQKAKEADIAAARSAVDEFGKKVLGDAQQLCPVDTGFLQGSATSSPAKIEGNGVTKDLGFNASYAIFVHENLTAHHDVGQAKFLETSIKRNYPQMDGFVASWIAAARKGGE